MTRVDFKHAKEVLSVPDVLAIAGHQDGLKTLGNGGLRGRCPLCDRPKTFNVTPSGRGWKCFGCDEAGDLIKLVCELNQVTVQEAGRVLVDEYGYQPPEPTETPATTLSEPADAAAAVSTSTGNDRLSFELKKLDPEDTQITELLGFRADTARHFGAGVHNGKGLMSERIAVPFHNTQGELLAYLGMKNAEPPVWPDAFDPFVEIYNLHRASAIAGGRLVVAAAVTDVWRLYEAGIEDAVYLPRAIPYPTRQQLAALLLAPVDRVVLLESRAHRQRELAHVLEQFMFTRLLAVDKDVTLWSPAKLAEFLKE